MARKIIWSILGGALLCAMATPSSAADVGIDPSATWLGFMNVFELPANGGGYVFGSGWGTPDLTAVFSDSNTLLTLGPNSVNDANPFWYTPAGGPGSTGNKICDANFYQESTGVYTGQTLNFSGTVLTNTMIAPYTQVAFIKDFASDYSSNVTMTVPLTPGPFTVSLATINDPTRHVQFGFEVSGPDVWITDRDPVGTVTLSTASTPVGVHGDYNGNGTVDAADYTVWRDHFGQDYALAESGYDQQRLGQRPGLHLLEEPFRCDDWRRRRPRCRSSPRAGDIGPRPHGTLRFDRNPPAAIVARKSTS